MSPIAQLPSREDAMPTDRKQEPWPADLGLSWGSCWEGLGFWCPPHPEERQPGGRRAGWATAQSPCGVLSEA